MIWLLVIAIIISIIVAVLYYLFHTRYYKFAKTNSKALQELLDINKSYYFIKIDRAILTNDYDNEKMYDNVSCYDYLIYQLQFDDNRNYYLNLINSVNQNKALYEEYLNVIKNIKLGEYKTDIQKLNINWLINVEKELLKQNELHPVTIFKMEVFLRYINMGGRLISTKNKFFDEYDICHAIDLLNDRNGKFYNNREVWDSICHVERARVSNKMRFSIYERDNYRCRMCHRKFSSEQLEIDHIYPIAKGGKSTYDNLQTLCKKCNKLKGDRIM